MLLRFLANLGKTKLIVSKSFSSENTEEWFYQFDGTELNGFNYINVIINYTKQGTSSSWFSSLDTPNICQIPYYIHYGYYGIDKPLDPSNMYFATFNRWDTKNGQENFPSFKISNISHKVPLEVKIYAVRLYA